MTNPFTPAILAAAAAHAREAYPRESCGLVVGDAYWACENVARDPHTTFEIADPVVADAQATGRLLGVVHSHPRVLDEPVRFAPSAADMTAQQAMCLPWAIVPLDEDRVYPTTVFGDELGAAPLIGRSFLHGVHDCMALIRDAYRLGKAGCSAQGVSWPFEETVELPNQPRSEGWWREETGDLYREHFPRVGFRVIAETEVMPGDVFLCVTPNVRGANPRGVVNHGGLYLGGNLILHHLPTRLSRREAIGSWRRAVALWLRHEIGDRHLTALQEAAAREAAAHEASTHA